jgi:xylulokinase
MEGVTMGMNYGLRRLVDLGVKARQIRVTGGGANSKLWRQIRADIFNVEVVTLKVGEGAAYGAAIQAIWCVAKNRGEKVKIEDLTARYVKINSSQTAKPSPSNAKLYREIQLLQDELSGALRDSFRRHENIWRC